MFLRINKLNYKKGSSCYLSDIEWSVERGSIWSVEGPNGSGKSLLAEIIVGNLSPSSGNIDYADTLLDEGKIGYLSFEKQEHLMDEERRKDESWIMHGNPDPGSTGYELLVRDLSAESAGSREMQQKIEELASLFHIQHLLNRGCRFYSTGEYRKILLCQSLLKDPELLLLDEPYDGLDRESRAHLDDILPSLAAGGITLIFFLNRKEERPRYAEKLLRLDRGMVVYSGDPSGFIDGNEARRGEAPPELLRGGGEAGFSPGEILIDMRHVTLSYGETRILSDVNWTVRAGESWMLTGPNGSGKSTILGLIHGDNPKVYGQEVYLFGNRRGSGESVWDIKKRIGFVSGDFHFRYYISVSIRDVVLSGFFDSIGLYDSPTPLQNRIADEWISWLAVSAGPDQPFHRLSFGEQRLVLIARAMVKKPEVLIADEPCHSLDDENRGMVLELLAGIGEWGSTTLLYVTHDPKEYLPRYSSRITLVPHESGGHTAVIS